MILAGLFESAPTAGQHFRQWATARLSEYLVKAFVMGDERLKDPDPKPA